MTLTRKTPMKRGTSQLKRSGPIKAKAPKRREPKLGGFPYVRSRALLDLFKSLPCQVTGKASEPAHSNWGVHGKARSIKASDIYVAALCHDLHAELDQGSKMSREERQRLWWDAHASSVRTLVDSGRWPAGIPVPDIENYPF